MSVRDVEGLVTRVWERHRDEADRRLDTLEDAAVAVLEGRLDESGRARGERAAHQLAGALGTFGYADGTILARDAERMLATPPAAGDVARLFAIVESLRGEIAGPPGRALPAPVLAEFLTEAPPAPDDAPGDNRAPLAAPARGDPPAFSAGTPAFTVDVAIVEDDAALAELLVHALATAGRSTRWIADGAAAATALTGSPPSLVPRVLLLDVDLPGLGGMALLRELAARGTLAATRVIMLTVRATEAEVVQAFELGCFDHVAKPFSLPVLLHRIARAHSA